MSQTIYQNKSGEFLVYLQGYEVTREEKKIGCITSTRWMNDLQKAKVFQSPLSKLIYDALNEKVGGVVPWEVSIKIERDLVKMKCQDCGKECSETYPKIIFKDKCHCICENCSINYYEDSNGKIKLRERF